MLFSLVVPVYNVCQYLPKCMDSLLTQNFEDYEIILVDDGSTDGKSGPMCDDYAARFPEKVRAIHQENGGLGAARNTGLEASKGEYLFFVDSDDYIARHALSYLAAQIQKTHGDMYIFSLRYVRGDSVFPCEPSRLPMGTPMTLETHPQLLLETPSACARIWRRSLFLTADIRFPARVWYEDLCTTPKYLYHAKSIIALPEPLYFYLLRDGSIMHNSNLRRNLEILNALDTIRVYFQQQGCLDACSEAMCCLAVDSALMAAQRVLMADPKADFLPDFLEYVKKNYPNYRENPLLSCLGRKKRIVLWLLERKQYRLLRGMFTLRRRLGGQQSFHSR